jgi:predicted permease
MGLFVSRDSLLDEELCFHVEELTEDNIRAGMTAEEARRQALLQVGGRERIKEEYREGVSFRLLQDLGRDLGYGLRQLRRSAGFAAMAIATLALGIAATTAVFSLVNSTLLANLPYRDASRLVEISITSPRYPGSIMLDDRAYIPWKQSARSCDRIAAFFDGDSTLAGGAGAEFPTRVHVAWVSEDFFPMLGVPAAIGRTFQPSDFPTSLIRQEGMGAAVRYDFAPGERAPILISNRLFQSRFGGKRGLLGQTLQITFRPCTVIGVVPDGFNLPQDTDIWIPQRVFSNPPGTAFLIARLAPGMSKDQAKAELDAVVSSLGRSAVLHPGFPSALLPTYQSKVVSLREYLVGNVRASLLALLGAVALAMLIVCINVTNLLLLRNHKRRHEMGVRAALGASSARLARQTLTESALLALIGGAAGILLACWMIRALPGLAPQGLLPRNGAALDTRVLLVAALITALTSILVGVLPALRQPWSALSEAIKQAGGHEATSGRELLHSVLVAAQVGLTLVLLCGAGLMVRSFILLRGATPDFRSAKILKFEVTLSGFKGASSNLEVWASQSSYRRQFYQRLTEQLQWLPGVKRVAISSALAGSRRSTSGTIRGQPGMINRVSPGYFEMLGIPLIAGRTFTPEDNRADAPRVVIISRTAARVWFGSENAVGRNLGRIGEFGAPVVVGVVGDVKQLSVSHTVYPEIYLPILRAGEMRFAGGLRLDLGPPPTMNVIVETREEPGPFMSTIRRLLAGIDPDVPAYNAMTMQEYISSTLARDRFATLLLSLFAVMTLVLAAVGTYSVVAQSVEQRLREIAVRMALGARPGQVMKLVLVRGGVEIGAGLAAGLLGAMALTRVLTSLLYEVKPSDPGVFGVAAVLLIAVAFLACYGPARRAAKVDPLTILRAE